jgi:hypothetical protein
MAFDGKGLDDYVDKLAFCGHTIGRTVASSKELSYLEATEILKAADALDPVEAK